MEEVQREEIERRFSGLEKTIIVLDVPDIYPFMDPELVRILKESPKLRRFFRVK